MQLNFRYSLLSKSVDRVEFGYFLNTDEIHSRYFMVTDCLARNLEIFLLFTPNTVFTDTRFVIDFQLPAGVHVLCTTFSLL